MDLCEACAETKVATCEIVVNIEYCQYSVDFRILEHIERLSNKIEVVSYF